MGVSPAGKVAVAIPAYRRPDFLAQLLSALPSGRVKRIFIGIDGPRKGVEGQVAETARVAESYARESGIATTILRREANVGTAVNVLGTVAAMFREEQQGAVLEDDCLPSDDFFEFTAEALARYRDHPRMWMAAGSQMAPSAMIQGTHVLCPYGLIWGWATTRDKWMDMAGRLKYSLGHGLPRRPDRRTGIGRAEAAYWRAGHRRAAEGRLESWAMPLTATAIFHGKLGALPRVNLVTNIGNDARSVHTANDLTWTGRPTAGGLQGALQDPVAGDGEQVTEWLRKNLFGINSRHLVTTRITRVGDRIHGGRPVPLLTRVADDLS